MSRLDQLKTLLAKESDDVFLNFGLAMEYAKAKQFDECFAQFDKVIQLDRDYVAAYFQKGQTLAAMGETDTARDVLTAGIAAATRCGNEHAKGEMEEFLSML